LSASEHNSKAEGKVELNPSSEVKEAMLRRAFNTLRLLAVLVGAAFLVSITNLLAATPGGNFPLAPPPPGPPTALVGASIVDVEGGQIIKEGVVVIDGDRILATGPAASVKIPDGAKIIEFDGKFLVPGLINSHVHFASALPGVVPGSDTNSDIVLRMARAARLTLESGVTTVRIVGAQGGTDFSLKRAVNSGYVPGPRIEASGEVIVPTGGHGNREVNGPAEFAHAARDQIKAGASWIKISISGGLADVQGDIGSSPMLPEELKAVIDVAHRNGIKVTAHNGSPAAGDEALALGIDGFEHGYFLGEPQLRIMQQKGVWLVPTIIVSQPGSQEFFKRQRMPDWYMERVKSVSGEHFAMLKNAITLGVPIALGTDMDPFEAAEGTTSTIREAEYYVEAGMTPLAALKSMTSEAARMLRLSDDVGSIKPGSFADIVAVDANPLESISALRSIGFVMKGGQIIRHDQTK
jgi:imidazolonepropionase-like amidohydrolase